MPRKLFAFAAVAPARALEADKAEISRYALTESGLAKFAQATQHLQAIPGACAREDDDDGPDNESLDQMTARLNAIPGAQAAIQSAGMSAQRVPGGMPCSGRPSASSYENPQPRHIRRMRAVSI